MVSPNGFPPTLSELSEKQHEEIGEKKKMKRLLSWPHFLLLTQAKFPAVQIPRPPFTFQSDKESSTEVNEKESEV